MVLPALLTYVPMLGDGGSVNLENVKSSLFVREGDLWREREQEGERERARGGRRRRRGRGRK